MAEIIKTPAKYTISGLTLTLISANAGIWPDLDCNCKAYVGPQLFQLQIPCLSCILHVGSVVVHLRNVFVIVAESHHKFAQVVFPDCGCVHGNLLEVVQNIGESDKC
jgi:hypothetical protein